MKNKIKKYLTLALERDCITLHTIEVEESGGVFTIRTVEVIDGKYYHYKCNVTLDALSLSIISQTIEAICTDYINYREKYKNENRNAKRM